MSRFICESPDRRRLVRPSNRLPSQRAKAYCFNRSRRLESGFTLGGNPGSSRSALMAVRGLSSGGWRYLPMKVLFVHFGDNWIAGSERSLLDIMISGRDHGIEPVLWCSAPEIEAIAEQHGLPVHRDDFQFYFDYSSRRFSPATYLSLVRRGISLIRATGAEIVHCNSAAPSQWMVPAARWTGIPIITNIRAPYLARSRYVLGVHLVDSVVAVSAAVAQPFLTDGMPPDKVRVIYNGFDPTPLLKGDQSGLRAELGIPQDAMVGAIVGSLILRKGHDLLFQAMDLLSADLPPFHVLVVGEGPEREQFERLAAGRPVHFLGCRSDVGAILRNAADMLLIPSRQEAFGRVIIEAAICGRPAIGTLVDGISEVIEDNVTGLLVPSESPSALAAAIDRLRAAPDLCRTMGDVARTRAKQFDLQKTIVNMVDHYRTIRLTHRQRRLSFASIRSLIGPYWNLAGTIRLSRRKPAAGEARTSGP